MNQTDSLADRIRVFRDLGIIPGLLFHVTKKRLVEHCRARSAHHAGRAKEKDSQIPELEKGLQTLQESIEKIKGFDKPVEVPSFSNKTSANYAFDGSAQVAALENQIELLRRDIKDHNNKAAMFEFMAESLFEGVYALNWAELQQLELAR